MTIRQFAPRLPRVVDDRHLHGVKPARDGLADRAHAHKADGAVAQRCFGERIVPLTPLADAQIALRLRKFTNRAEQQAERGVGDFLGQHIRRVGEDDAVRGGPFDIHVVIADAKARDDLQFGKPRHEVARDSFGRGAASDRAHVGVRRHESVAVARCGDLVQRAAGVQSVDDDRLERPEQQNVSSFGFHPQVSLIPACSPAFPQSP